MSEICDGKSRGSIHSGLCVDIIQKQDQRSGKKTRGVVSEILTGSSFHPHGIKVRLKDGTVGRVCTIIQEETFSLNQAQD
ncbi:YwbE family protein [Methanospirillum lacunae]|uniref:YwbE family protein n=1 Tax=Methanospirillum lacunae TaxID=668570 RepID=A0A2V2N5K5_9EURY|nr:YwbE family protein [Methanospirillum lacunae]PWR71497.1 YwbE family protein [Methanospirillum lacunae]